MAGAGAGLWWTASGGADARTAEAMAGRASAMYVFKYGVGDLIAQQAAAPGAEIDRKRTASFGVFGGYYGVVNYTVFRALAWSPWPAGLWSKAIFSALFDGFIHVPVLFYPQFYFFKEVVSSADWRAHSLREHFFAGLEKYKANYYADIMASAGVFVPLGLLNFRFVRLHRPSLTWSPYSLYPGVRWIGSLLATDPARLEDACAWHTGSRVSHHRLRAARRLGEC